MADLNFSLLPWQQEVFADKTRFKVVAAGTTVNRYLRVNYTVAGSTGSATPVVAFTRR